MARHRSMPASSVLRSLLSLNRAERRFVAIGWMLAPVAALSLRTRGFHATAQLANRAPRVFMGPVAVERAEELTKAAFRHALVRPGCLPESIVQLALHRMYGNHVRLLVGVRRRGHHGDVDVDFEGHAWIEGLGGPKRDQIHLVIFELASA